MMALAASLITGQSPPSAAQGQGTTKGPEVRYFWPFSFDVKLLKK